MAKVHPLHTGAGVNLILSAPCHAFQTQSVAFVRLCGSVRHDKQGNNSNLLGRWVDLTAFLWLGVMTVKMGALEGVFDVFVLHRAGSGSPLHALMSWCGVWCWPSNLLWCSGPSVHLSILLSLLHTQIHSLHTQSASQARGRNSLIYITSRKRLALLPGSILPMMKRRKICTYVCLAYLNERDGIRDLHAHLSGLFLMLSGLFFLFLVSIFFFQCVFSHSFAKSPPKKPIFVQAASVAFQMHNCFPLWALLFPGMLISCDDQRDTRIKVLLFKHFVVFMLLP